MNTNHRSQRGEKGNTLLAILILVTLVAIAILGGARIGVAAEKGGFREVKVASIDPTTGIVVDDRGRSYGTSPSVRADLMVGRTVEVRTEAPAPGASPALPVITDLRREVTVQEQPAKERSFWDRLLGR